MQPVISSCLEALTVPPSSPDERRGRAVDSTRRIPGGVALAVRRAEALIVSKPDASFTADSLARAVGVSARTLSRGFQRLRGYSPTAAVRRARLARVRLDLMAAASRESVTEVAMRWGFFHLGRFSGVYASHFGELPSATRRRYRQPQQPAAMWTTAPTVEEVPGLGSHMFKESV